MSDTQITNRHQLQPNAIPGRLKSIVINKWLTISYAGTSESALDSIREVWKLNLLSTDKAIGILKEYSEKRTNVISSFSPTSPQLTKIDKNL